MTQRFSAQNPLKIGSRKSPLALAQAELVRGWLQQAHPYLAEKGAIEIVSLVTTGDRFLQDSLADVGGKGLFTKELEEGLLSGAFHFAVHSAKDMKTVLHDELTLACIPEREDARDVLISKSGAKTIDELPEGITVGTASLRRSTQLQWKRPDLNLVVFRGNIQTRMKKLEAGEAEATLLAAAGLKRMKLDPLPGALLAVDDMLPAVGQGALGLECRKDSGDIIELLQPLNHASTAACVSAERAMLEVLDGSCRTPIAGHATLDKGGNITLTARLLKDDASECYEERITGPASDAVTLGKEVGAKLKKKAGR